MRLTRAEIMLVAGLMAALLLGAVVKHWREQRRLERTTPVSQKTVS